MAISKADFAELYPIIKLFIYNVEIVVHQYFHQSNEVLSFVVLPEYLNDVMPDNSTLRDNILPSKSGLCLSPFYNGGIDNV